MLSTIKFKPTQTSCRSCGLFKLCVPHGLNEKELIQFDNAIEQRQQYKRSDYLYHNGDPMQAVYAVRTGSFKVTTSDVEGVEQVIGFYFPGDLIGLEGFADQYHHCDVTALESASVCQLSCADLEILSGQSPNLRREVMMLFGREVSNSHRKLLVLGNMNAEERMAAFLTKLSSDFSKRGFSSTEFNLSMSRYDIASYLGIAVETVSRVFTRMQEDNLIVVNRRNMHILDMDSLCALAHETPVSLHHLAHQQVSLRVAL
jgi:CRP/FNR family transcriptional regulator